MALLVVAPSQIALGEAFWVLPTARWIQIVGLAFCYVIVAALDTLGWLEPGPRPAGRLRLPGPVATSVGLLAAFYLTILVMRWPYSRSVVLLGSALYIGLLLPPLLIRRPRRALTFSVAAVALGVAGVSFGAAIDFGSESRTARAELLHTHLHTLRATYYPLLDDATVVGGGLARLGEEVLLVTGDGRTFLLAWADDSLRARRLRLDVPANRDAFVADLGGEAGDERFRVAGLVVLDTGDQLQIYASHHFWHQGRRCFVLRLSAVTLRRDELPIRERGPMEAAGMPAPVGSTDDESLPEWSTVYETEPCLPLESGRGYPFAGHQAGGRIAVLGDTALLLTVGDHQRDGVNAPEIVSQDTAVDYGKTLWLSMDGSRVERFTLGHRNAQGLAVAPDGRIWLTEHGPEGGDELNELVRGENYGWPVRTAGTDYGQLSWPLEAPGNGGPAYREPVHTWVPGIGISNLLVMEGDRFPHWTGDLIVSSLAALSLYRVRFHRDRVEYVERVEVGERIRDIVEAADGHLVLWTDRGNVVRLSRADTDQSAAVLGQCVTCHASAATVAPDLRLLYGRGIASLPRFPYSEALRAKRGRWTEDRLDEFLRDPQAFAPGTTMEFPGIEDPDVRARVIEHLRVTAVR